MTRFKKLYEALLENSELYVMFDGMTGEWEEDKNEFIEAQKLLEQSALDINGLNAFELLESVEQEEDNYGE
jgi:hypothetical protein